MRTHAHLDHEGFQLFAIHKLHGHFYFVDPMQFMEGRSTSILLLVVLHDRGSSTAVASVVLVYSTLHLLQLYRCSKELSS